MTPDRATDVAAQPLGPQVAVIVVAYQSRAHLQRCMDALAAQTFSGFELVVWDNGSTDGALDALRAPAHAILRRSDNIGFAAANNRAVALTRAPAIALLNPDAFPEPDWLERLVAALNADSQAGAVGSVQLDDADPSRLDGAGDVYHAFGIPFRGGYGASRPARIPAGEIFGPCAAAAIYRREAFDALGGFDESFFCYCEDVDLAFRLRAAGWRCRLEPRAVVRHVGSASAGLRSAFAVRHGVRNRLWTFVKNMPAPLLIAMAPAHVAMTAGLWLRDAVRDPAAARATAAGLRDGLAGLPQIWRARRNAAGARATPWWRLARAFCWNPWTLLRRAPDIREAAPTTRDDHAAEPPPEQR